MRKVPLKQSIHINKIRVFSADCLEQRNVCISSSCIHQGSGKMPCLNVYLSIGNARGRVFLLLTGIRMLRLQIDFIFSVLYMSEKVMGR